MGMTIGLAIVSVVAVVFAVASAYVSRKAGQGIAAEIQAKLDKDEDTFNSL